MLVTIQIGVLFPMDAPQRAGTRVDIPAHEVLREGDDLAAMSDATLISRVESYLDLPEGAMRQMIVQRPEAGNIMITAKTGFGEGSKVCPTCNGAGLCRGCAGYGCRACGGNGNCPDCGGLGRLDR